MKIAGIVQANDTQLKGDVTTSVNAVWDFLAQNDTGIG